MFDYVDKYLISFKIVSGNGDRWKSRCIGMSIFSIIIFNVSRVSTLIYYYTNILYILYFVHCLCNTCKC